MHTSGSRRRENATKRSEDEGDDWPGEDPVSETPIDSPPTLRSMIEPEETLVGDGTDEDWDSIGKGPGHSRIVASDHSEMIEVLSPSVVSQF